MLIDFPSATPVPEISGTSPPAQSFISRRCPEGHANWWGLTRHRLGHRSSWLDMKCPAEVYQPSTRVYQGLPDTTSLPRQEPRRHALRPPCLGHRKIDFGARLSCFAKTEATVGAGSGLFSCAAAHSARQPQRTSRPAILLFGIRLSLLFSARQIGPSAFRAFLIQARRDRGTHVLKILIWRLIETASANEFSTT
jgi:hypothetical protein